MPLDVLENIAALLGPSELEALSTAATVFQPATERILRFAHIGDARLVENIQWSPKASEEELMDEDVDKTARRRNLTVSLTRKVFSTAVRGSAGPVLIVGGKLVRARADEGTGGSFAISLGDKDVHGVGWEEVKDLEAHTVQLR